MTEHEKRYLAAMEQAILKELPELLDRQFDAFHKAALPFFEGEDDKEPPWMRAADVATYRLRDLVKEETTGAVSRFWWKQEGKK